jgi:hypothetical protein
VAAVQVTGDLDVRWDVEPDDWDSGNVVELGGKWVRGRPEVVARVSVLRVAAVRLDDRRHYGEQCLRSLSAVQSLFTRGACACG